MSITTLFGTRLLSGLGALALVGGLASGTAIAGNPSRSDDAHAEGKAKGKEIAALRHDLKDRVAPERQAIEALRRSLAEEYAKADPNEAELQRLHDAIQAHRNTIDDMRHAALVDMHDQLSPEQRAKMAERMASKHGKHGGKGKGKGEGKAKAKAKADKQDKAKADKQDKGKGKAKGKGKPEANDR